MKSKDLMELTTDTSPFGEWDMQWDELASWIVEKRKWVEWEEIEHPIQEIFDVALRNPTQAIDSIVTATISLMGAMRRNEKLSKEQ